MPEFVSLYTTESQLDIDSSLKINSEFDEEIDPITYEVLRHSLWNVNVEHGLTMVNVSGSPIAVYAHDFNTTILTELGDWVYIGPFLQVLAASADSAVKWTLEHRSKNPGIHDGDIFLTNDPWIGAIHQQDVNTLCPVFYEGELFAWVTNTLHQYDLGGSTPGSFCPDARDVYFESVPIPPIKIVEKGRIRTDIEESYIRRSRLQRLISLDLRAMIAGCLAARNRIIRLIERYGPRVVKGTMRKITSDAEKVFLHRLATIPEGTWREKNYLEVALPGDRSIYPVVLTLKKKKDKLIFENEGTHDQTGALNNTFIGWKGAILTGICQIFLHDQFYAIGGGLRHIEFKPSFGKITCANYPAAVSVSPPSATLLTQGQSLHLLSKMVMTSSSEELRQEVNAKFSGNQFPIVSLAGIDQRGDPVSGILLDAMSSAIGAFSFRDGIATGGFPFDPLAMCPNVEYNEQFFPMLYLYRKELKDSGGSGKFKGGNSAVSAFTPYGTSALEISVTTSGAQIPTTDGLCGGYPGSTNRLTILQNGDVLSRLRRSEPVTDLGMIEGQRRVLSSKERDLILKVGDVLEVYAGGAAGFGDPLERKPRTVRQDVLNEDISSEAAEKLYGVIIDRGSKEVREEETKIRRTGIRKRRLNRDPQPPVVDRNSNGSRMVSEYLTLEESTGQRFICCRCCGHRLSRVEENYKNGCLHQDLNLSQCNLLIAQPKGLDLGVNQVIFRQFFCPDCGVNIENEICRAEDEFLEDIMIE